MVDFLSGRCHCTKYAGATSELMGISASIIQGSAIGPVTYIVNAADLKTVTDGNQIHADDNYIILPATNSHTRETELKNVEQWAQANNLKLKRANSLETRICAAEMAVRYAALSACRKVHVCHCNSRGGAT